MLTAAAVHVAPPTTWLHEGDCVEWLRSLAPESVDAIVTDPPYGLGFMGRSWDALPPGRDWAEACLRVLKPGGHLVAFGGTRTVHRLTCAIEDAGFEIRDSVGWVYYSGFPKSLDVSKALDAAAGATREVVSERPAYGIGGTGCLNGHSPGAVARVTAPATDAARAWAGWGTALKPAIEPAVLARKPLVGTVAANVARYGTGALNIDATRFAPGDVAWVGPGEGTPTQHGRSGKTGDGIFAFAPTEPGESPGMALGRFPANLFYCPKAPRKERERGLTAANMLCGCEATRVQWANEDREAATRAETEAPPRKGTIGSCPAAECEWPTSSSGSASTDPCREGTKSTTSTRTSPTTTSGTSSSSTPSPTSGSTPDASCGTVSGSSRAASAGTSSPSTSGTGTSPAKGTPSTDGAGRATSPASSRTSGGVVPGVRTCPTCCRWDKQPTGSQAVDRAEGSAALASPRAGAGRTAAGIWCVHPTVKPVRLMRWLVRLVTPPGGIVIDPFLGSGSTGVAAVLEGFDFAGAEREPEYLAIATARVEHALTDPDAWAATATGAARDPAAGAKGAP